MALKKVKYPKKREALLKHYHRRTDGQKKIRNNLFVKEILDIVERAEIITEKLIQLIKRNTNANTARNTNTIIGFVLWNKNHPDEPMTEDEYIAYRKQKERKRKMQEKK